MNHVSFYRKGYPRPQMVRENWVDLNGIWAFRFDEKNNGKQIGLQKGFDGGLQIIVPFSYQTKASGVCDGRQCDCIWYSRKFNFESCGKRFILHFDGADYLTEVYVNGYFTGVHEGAYTRFSFDVTDFCKDGENVLTVRCEDTLSMEQPRGKQRWRKENFACWYEETCGLWKSVWGEYVTEEHILRLTSTFGADEQSVDICGECSHGDFDLCIRIKQEDEIVSECTYKISGGSFFVNQKILSDVPEPSGVRYWYPYSPFLYETEIELLQNGETKDRVQSYFAAVSFRISEGTVVLNKSHFYPRMILNQGYYTDSGITPKNDDDIMKDLALLSALGFNGARIHEKIEDERFYYYCDVMGIVVWTEMPSFYRYGQYAAAKGIKEWCDIILQYKSHPSIMAWVACNESWGVNNIANDKAQQAYVKAMTEIVKALDPYRFAIGNDGWENVTGDFITVHHYAETGKKLFDNMTAITDFSGKTSEYALPRTIEAGDIRLCEKPVLLTEFGGIAFDNLTQSGWGYGKTETDEESFLERLEGIMRAVYGLKNVKGFCYTQLTDVQQEINGLLTDQREPKADTEAIAKLMRGEF